MAAAPATRLPAWERVLAVVAHPDDESFGLGAVIAGFVAAGAEVGVLCLTHGEASTVHGVPGDLGRVRAAELAAAAAALGARAAILRDYPDGALASVCRTRLAGEVVDAARLVRAAGLLVFDASGVTGHPDHAAATAAALAAAEALELPVLAWTLPCAVADTLNRESGAGFAGRPAGEVDLVVEVERGRQRRAVAAHPSQAVPSSVLWRRLELLGRREHLCWLRGGETAGNGAAAPPVVIPIRVSER